MSCKKAQGFLESHGCRVADESNASRDRRGRKEALALAREMKTIVVARGKKHVVFDMRKPPDDDTLSAHLLGPTGNLKAPTLRVGSMLLVGFGAEVYQDYLASRGG